MAKRLIVVEYEFTSTRADGDSYTRQRTIKADNEQSALNIAQIIGGSEFGIRFTDNCIDWRIAKDATPNKPAN